METSPYDSNASMESFAFTQHSASPDASEKSAHTFMGSLMRDSKGTADFSADPAKSRTQTALLISTTLKKKKKLSACSGNLPRRHAEFRKRRDQLFKKAGELSESCSDEVAAIVISPSGKVSEFASSRFLRLQ